MPRACRHGFYELGKPAKEFPHAPLRAALPTCGEYSPLRVTSQPSLGILGGSKGSRANAVRTGCLETGRGELACVIHGSRSPFPVEGWGKGNFGNLVAGKGCSPCVAWLGAITGEGNLG
jgi:hypothetical protein